MVVPAVVSGLTAFCAMLSFVSLVAESNRNPTPDASSPIVSLICCLGPVWLLLSVPLIRAVIGFLTTEFAVTNSRVIAKTGLIRQESLELMLTKVESVGVDQSMIGRLFDYGSIVVSGSGGTHQKFPNIAHPLTLRKKVNMMLHGEETKSAPKKRLRKLK